MMEISETEQDAIVELFNMGMGQAAASLSAMVGGEVTLSIPHLEIKPSGQIAELDLVRRAERICAVSEAFDGPFTGRALLIFPETSSLRILRCLMPLPPDPHPLSDDEGEALAEVGNIVLNGCLGCLANLMEMEIDGGVPSCRIGSPAQVFEGRASPFPVDEHVLFVRIDMGLADQGEGGHTLFVLDIGSVEAFLDAVRRFLSAQGPGGVG
ncbi:MAG TPA: chemotaxis protein [Azospirillaceae bacterium]|nr:chemotaxis protein [Azospirillaceae bacterium]